MNNKESIDTISTDAFLGREAELLPELTPRQQQVLALIKAGKVNKEIANELGIGLGTVKQHVVALFKKLQVSNRTMAVSQGSNQAPVYESDSAEISESLLQRRPCIALSIFLPDAILHASSNPMEIVQQLHKTFSALANSHDALYLTSKTHTGDLIFGVKRGTEQDIFKALRAARAVFDALADYPNITPNLRGGLTAGLAISSMNRHGGWSGEVVASTVIAQARELASNATAGELVLSVTAKKLLEIIGPNVSGLVVSSVFFDTLNRMPWGQNIQFPQFLLRDDEASRCAPPILGRDAELERLELLLSEVFDGKNRLVYVEGETGMGKSLLCRFVAERSLAMKGRVHHFISHSGIEESHLYMFPSGAPVKPHSLLHCLRSVTGHNHDVIIVDDAHLLPAAMLTKVIETANEAKGKLIVVAARKLPKSAVNPSATIRLGHLSKTAIENLIAQAIDQWVIDALKAGEDGNAVVQKAQDRRQTVETVAHHASGVPLFAIELARHNWQESLPLSLQVVINARMDGLKLDRALLRLLSKTSTPLTAAEIAEAMWEPLESIQIAVDQAIACGVLRQNDDGRISYAHPLLCMLVNQAGVE
jgi:DNA-binding CsgD family transcriptional regulator